MAQSEKSLVEDKLGQVCGHFHCTQCGACCSHLEAFGGVYADLDNGQGVCRYYDPITRLCTCYEKRPLKCRVDDSYEQIFKSQMSYDEFIQLTVEGCERLQQLPDKFKAKQSKDKQSKQP